MKSILHVITTIERGGAENQLVVLVDQQVKLGYKVSIIYLKGEPELQSEFERRGAIVLHDLADLSPIQQILKLSRIIKSNKSIVHSHLPRAELLTSLCFNHFSFVVTRHNAEAFFPSGSALASRMLSRFVSWRAHKIIAISSAVGEWLLENKEIKNDKKLLVIYYGYSPKLSDRKMLSRLNSKTLEIGTISRLTNQKDLPTLINAFNRVYAQIPHAKLSIVGSGPLEEFLRSMVDDLGLEHQVRFVGRLSNVYEFLQTLDVFVLTSLYEGFGMVLLEAMDAQVPIVASDNSAIPEVLGKGFPGLCRTGHDEDFYKGIMTLTDKRFEREFLEIQNKRLQIFDAREMAVKVIRAYPNS